MAALLGGVGEGGPTDLGHYALSHSEHQGAKRIVRLPGYRLHLPDASVNLSPISWWLWFFINKGPQLSPEGEGSMVIWTRPAITI
jgi:hypothetical protein